MTCVCTFWCSCRITEDVCAYPTGDLEAYRAVRPSLEASPHLCQALELRHTHLQVHNTGKAAGILQAALPPQNPQTLTNRIIDSGANNVHLERNKIWKLRKFVHVRTPLLFWDSAPHALRWADYQVPAIYLRNVLSQVSISHNNPGNLARPDLLVDRLVQAHSAMSKRLRFRAQSQCEKADCIALTSPHLSPPQICWQDCWDAFKSCDGGRVARERFGPSPPPLSPASSLQYPTSMPASVARALALPSLVISLQGGAVVCAAACSCPPSLQPPLHSLSLSRPSRTPLHISLSLKPFEPATAAVFGVVIPDRASRCEVLVQTGQVGSETCKNGVDSVSSRHSAS
eukprot:1107817-Rhodomonas_salina.1